MLNDNQENKINEEDIWWVYVYIINLCLNKKGYILTKILEYGGVVEDIKFIQEKLEKDNGIQLHNYTIKNYVKDMMLKGLIEAKVINKKRCICISKDIIIKALLNKEKLLSQQW